MTGVAITSDAQYMSRMPLIDKHEAADWLRVLPEERSTVAAAGHVQSQDPSQGRRGHAVWVGQQMGGNLGRDCAKAQVPIRWPSPATGKPERHEGVKAASL
jgi:hypothetical protein